MRIKRILSAFLAICFMASALCINVGAAIVSSNGYWSVTVEDSMFINNTLVVAENDEEFWNDANVSVTDGTETVSSVLRISGDYGPNEGAMTIFDATLSIASSSGVEYSVYLMDFSDYGEYKYISFDVKDLIDGFVSLGGTKDDFKVTVTFTEGYEAYLKTTTHIDMMVPRLVPEKEIVVDMHFPKAGENFSLDISAPEGADYTVSDLYWQASGEALTAEDKAEAGVDYRFGFTVNFNQSLDEEVYVKFTTVDGTSPYWSSSYQSEFGYEVLGGYTAPLEVSFDVPVPEAGDTVVTAVDLPEGTSIHGDNEGVQWMYHIDSKYLAVLTDTYYYDTTYVGQLFVDLGMAYDSNTVKINIPGWTQVERVSDCDGSTPVFQVRKRSGETNVANIRFLVSTEEGRHIDFTADISQPPKTGEFLYESLINGYTYEGSSIDDFYFASFKDFGNIVWHIKEDGAYTKITDTFTVVEKDASYYGYACLRNKGLNTDITLDIPGWTQIDSADEATGAPEYVIEWNPDKKGNRWYVHFYYNSGVIEQPKDTLPDDLAEEPKEEIETVGGESVEDGVVIPANTEIVIADATTELTPEHIVSNTIEAEKDNRNTKYYLKTVGFAGTAIIEGEDADGNPVRATLAEPTYTTVEDAPAMLFSLEPMSSNKIVTGYYSISALCNAYVRAGGVMERISSIKIVSEDDSLITSVSIVSLTKDSKAKVTGWFMTGDKHHARIIGRAIITLEHEFNEKGICTYCHYDKAE